MEGQLSQSCSEGVDEFREIGKETRKQPPGCPHPVGAEDESGKALKRSHTRPPRCHSQRRVNAPSRAAEVDKGADFSDGGFRRVVGPEGRLDKLRKSGWLASGNPKCNLFSQYYVMRGRKEMPLPPLQSGYSIENWFGLIVFVFVLERHVGTQTGRPVGRGGD